MDEVYELQHRIGYFQVDHAHRIQLSSLFKLLQEAAIHHANQANIGTRIMDERGESWILNRVAMQLERYPRVDEMITIKTWATQMKHFKGFRDFRIWVDDELIGQVSTLWLYVDLKTKTITRLPKHIETDFPTQPDQLYFEELDRLRLPKPGPDAKETTITLRYSDIDGNQHVNNAVYMDFLQTALHHQNLDTRPKELKIQFSKEISPEAKSVYIQLKKEEETSRFGIRYDEELAAFGHIGP